MKFSKILLILPFILVGMNAFSQLSQLKDLAAKKKKAKVESALNFKTLNINGTEIKCQRTTPEERDKLTADAQAKSAIQDIEDYLEFYYQKVKAGEFFEQKPTKLANSSLLFENVLSDLRSSDPDVTTDHYDNEYKAYQTYYDNQSKNPGYYAYRVKSFMDRGLHDFAVEDLEKSLTLDPANSATRNIAKEVYYKTAVHSLEEGKSKLNLGIWEDGQYFYKALQYLANASTYGWDKSDIAGRVQDVNAAAESSEKEFKFVDASNLYKVSSSYQAIAAGKRDSLQQVIKGLKTRNAEKQLIVDAYTRLIDLQEYQMAGGRYKGFATKDLVERGKLRIDLGEVSQGCQEIYEADILYFVEHGYQTGACREWHQKRSVLEDEKYKKEEKAKAEKWYASHPSQIKLRSLLGENFTTLSAYLGEPISRNYKIDVGAGFSGTQYIGNRYKNKHGVYEVGFSNGAAVLIQFRPTAAIKYSPEIFKEKGSTFDLDGGYKGTCHGSESDGNVSEILIHSINYNCSGGIASTVFSGLNGTLLSVSAY